MSNAPPPVDPNEKIPEKIPAEKKFDQAVYGGISYAAQAGTGVLLSHSIRYGRLREPFNNFVKFITGKPPSKAASTTAVIAIMVMVGNTFLLPVHWLEKRKARFVRAINDRMNEKCPPSPEAKEAQEARIHYLEHHAPKQNWWSLGMGRGFGLGVVFGVDHLIGEKRNAFLQDKSAVVIQRGLGAMGMKMLAESKMLGNYLRIGFIDSFYSMVSAGGLYVYSHFIDPPKKPKAISAPAPSNPPSDDNPSSGKRYADKFQAAKAASWEHSIHTSCDETALGAKGV